MPLTTVTFSFRTAAAPEPQKTVLVTVNSWSDVSRAGLLKPDAKRDNVRLMAYAYVADEGDASDVAKRLAELPDVEPKSVSVASPRRLV